MTAALVAAPMASAAGDPIASGSLKLKITKGFKKELKRNHVRMGPKSFKIKPNVSNLDPVTGTGKLMLRGKLKFRGHGKKVVAKKLSVHLSAKAGNLKGKVGGRNMTLMRLRSKPNGAGVARNGFGATVTGVSARLGKGLAKAVNKKLGLHSLVVSRRLAKLTVTEQPTTVQVTRGFVNVAVPFTYLPATLIPPAGPGQIPGTGTDPNTVAAKEQSHCISTFAGSPVIAGDPANPARETTGTSPDPVLGPPPTGVAALYRFPVTGGTVGPDGKDGALQVSGGITLQTGTVPADGLQGGQPGSCDTTPPGAATSHSLLNTEFNRPAIDPIATDPNVGPNLQQQNVQSYVTIGGTSPGCNGTSPGAGTPASPVGCAAPLGGAGFKGVSIGQVLDSSGAAVSADPNAKTVAIGNVVIKNNATTSAVLNQLFPNASGDPAQNFADGDKFGISSVTVNTR